MKRLLVLAAVVALIPGRSGAVTTRAVNLKANLIKAIVHTNNKSPVIVKLKQAIASHPGETDTIAALPTFLSLKAEIRSKDLQQALDTSAGAVDELIAGAVKGATHEYERLLKRVNKRIEKGEVGADDLDHIKTLHDNHDFLPKSSRENVADLWVKANVKRPLEQWMQHKPSDAIEEEEGGKEDLAPLKRRVTPADIPQKAKSLMLDAHLAATHVLHDAIMHVGHNGVLGHQDFAGAIAELWNETARKFDAHPHSLIVPEGGQTRLTIGRQSESAILGMVPEQKILSLVDYDLRRIARRYVELYCAFVEEATKKPHADDSKQKDSAQVLANLHTGVVADYKKRIGIMIAHQQNKDAGKLVAGDPGELDDIDTPRQARHLFQGGDD